MQPKTRTSAESRFAAIKAFHDRLLELDSVPDYFLCGWSSEQSQRSRFEALLRSVRFEGGSVIDYGCGTGRLFEFISRLGYNFTYVGLDMNEDMLSVARKSHDAEFRRVPADSTDFAQADYVFASGIFQFRDMHNPTYHILLTEALFGKATRGFAANYLSNLRASSEKQEDELYLTANDLTDLGARLSSRWVLDHSYHPGRGDMTLGVLKEHTDQSWKRPTF